VLSCHDSSAAPQTVQTASPVCGTKNFSSVRLYLAPQLHCTIVAIPGICASDRRFSSPELCRDRASAVVSWGWAEAKSTLYRSVIVSKAGAFAPAFALPVEVEGLRPSRGIWFAYPYCRRWFRRVTAAPSSRNRNWPIRSTNQPVMRRFAGPL
jgi:hypothetical protein